jgi:hypothetical protein
VESAISSFSSTGESLETGSRNVTIQKRVLLDGVRQQHFWQLSQISLPQGTSWRDAARPPLYRYSADDSFGAGQTIYLVEDDAIDHPV